MMIGIINSLVGIDNFYISNPYFLVVSIPFYEMLYFSILKILLDLQYQNVREAKELTQKINKLEKYKMENEKIEKIFQNLEEAILTISNNKIEFKNHLASDIFDKHKFELEEKFLKMFSNSQEMDDN